MSTQSSTPQDQHLQSALSPSDAQRGDTRHEEASSRDIRKSNDQGVTRPLVEFLGLRLLYQPRALKVTWAMVALSVIVLIASLVLGTFDVSTSKVVDVLSGGGSSLERTVVLQWRLARCLVALTVGAALGFSGALTQLIARNGLASPDILGISRGATAGAVALIATVGTTSFIGVPLAAILGGLCTAAVIWALSRVARNDMYTLVLIGIGVNAGLQALIVYLLASTDLDTAAAARTWMMGTINGRTTEHLWPTLIVLLICFAVILRMSVYLPALQLGDDTAGALGVNTKKVNFTLLVVAVVLASTTVSAVGPVGFVAFVAPQVAARLAKTSHPPVVASAACGAALMGVADLIARTAFAWEVPVGIVTSAIGGPFLLWLLWKKTNRPQPGV